MKLVRAFLFGLLVIFGVETANVVHHASAAGTSTLVKSTGESDPPPFV